MSIQPNRVVARIIAQVDQSDWPSLESRVWIVDGSDRWVRVYRAPAEARYATPVHFWVHALREELGTVDRRADLVGAAGHALCRVRPVESWRAEIDAIEPGLAPGVATRLDLPDPASLDASTQVFRMLESPCRRSSVMDHRDGFVADFHGHGAGPSWRRRAR